MSSTPLQIVTVSNAPDKAKDLIVAVITSLKSKYDLVHLANCESIISVKYVLTSLITPPHILVTTSEWFEEEQEEVREIARRLLPNMHLIMIPSGLKLQEGSKATVEYLTEQIVESKLFTRSAV